MNPVIDLLRSHRSIRKFTEQAVDDGTLATLIEAGQTAATSSFIQACTVIQVKDRAKRLRLAELAGNQQYVESAAVFLVFCADFHRLGICCEIHQKPMLDGYTEQLITATVDTALFAQNTVIAAESLGLGCVYIGGIRNNPEAVSQLLELPHNTYPVFGLCMGYPAHNPETKPRLPLNVVLKQDCYSDSGDRQAIEHYDEAIRAYYRSRTGGKKDTAWSEQMASMLQKESRPHMKAFLQQHGFMLK